MDVNFSEWDCTLEEAVQGPRFKVPGGDVEGRLSDSSNLEHSLRLGFRMVSGLSKSHADVIVAARADRAFSSFDDFAHRNRLTNAVLSRLSKADVFGSLTLDRRNALWQSLPIQKVMPLLDAVMDDGRTKDADPEPAVKLPAASPLSEVVADYQATGLSLRDHPMKFIRPVLDKMRIAKASDLAVLPVNRRVKVAGLTLMRQRPGTASGITFVTLEDETGFANLIVRPEIWERFHAAARTATAMLAHGRLQRQENVIHVLVTRLDDLTEMLSEIDPRSRDFR